MGRPPTVPDFLFLLVSDSSLKGIYCYWGIRAIKMVSYRLLNLLMEMNTSQSSPFPQVGKLLSFWQNYIQFTQRLVGT